MNGFLAKLMPVVVAGILGGLALAGGDKEDMRSMDTDGDGRISAMEHADGAKMMFTRMDVNHDGRVTAAEMQAQMSMMDHDDKRNSMDSRDTQSARRPADRSSKAGMMSAAEKMAMMDSDGDGVLTGEEHAAAAKRMFTDMDADHDGSLTAHEMRKRERAPMSAHDE